MKRIVIVLLCLLLCSCAGNTTKIVYIEINQCTEQGNNDIGAEGATLKTETDQKTEGDPVISPTVTPNF